MAKISSSSRVSLRIDSSVAMLLGRFALVLETTLGPYSNGNASLNEMPKTGYLRSMKYWLLKTEPNSYSIDDLAKEKRKTTFWSGVRNYQARNFMRDDMKKGDLVLFYHSNAKPPCIVGVAEVVKESYPDFTSWDENDKHFDPKSTEESPRWFMVDIKLKKKFAKAIGRDQLGGVKSLKDMELLRKGSRLSVQPVREKEFQAILDLAEATL